MGKTITILLVALVFEAIGVNLLSRGLKDFAVTDRLSVRVALDYVVRGLTNPYIVLGIVFETIFFVALMYLLKRNDVSLIWPLTSLGFVITALAARFIQHEEVSWLRWCGVLLIVAGAGLVGLSESLKPKPAVPTIAEPTPGAGPR